MGSFKKLAATFCSTLVLTFGFAQLPVEQQQAVVLKRMIERNHYSPRPVNDSFSSFVFSSVLNSIDEDHNILTNGEYQQINSWRFKIDDELTGSTWGFVNQLSSIYAKALRRTDSVTTNLLEKPFDFSIADKVTVSQQKAVAYPANNAEIQLAWTKFLKWQILNSAYDLFLAQKPAKSFKEILLANEKPLREKFKRLIHTQLGELSSVKEVNDYILEIYLAAISNAFDPHTEYFSPEMKSEFESSLSTEAKSFGFVTDEKENKLVIAHLVPGGPAWKSGELHRNDQLLQLAFANKEPVDVAMLSPSEVIDMIQDPPSEEMTVKTKRPDGTIHSVALRRAIVTEEENSVKGYILSGDRKIGYVSLPDFYTVWEEGNGSGCAADVSKELINLKKEGIEGLILDVRYNGGGSLEEALQLIGIFINEGALVGIREKTGKVSYLKDPNRGTIYDGPMLVLINGESASASEALAASLQDYNRAIIAGSSSFGKGSMQEIFPLDTTTSNRNAGSALGFAKITTGKFFRLDGTTVQLKGVEPDIVLPDAFMAVKRGESSMLQVLTSDTIKRNSYYKPLAPLPVNELKQASAQRVAMDPGFITIQDQIKQYREFNSSPTHVVPMKLELFEKWRMQYDDEKTDRGGNTKSSSKLYKVTNHKYESQLLQNNAYAAGINQFVINNLQQDIYIEECYRIISDLIQKTK